MNAPAPQPGASARPRAIAVIPAYNEGPTVAHVAAEAARQCPAVVIDDGSTDDTAAQLTGLPVTVLTNERNRGKAFSLWRGFRHALEQGADAVISLDGDGQHAAEEIPRLIEGARAQPHAIIVAARCTGRDRAPPLRRFANRAADFWISWAAGYRIDDTQSGFRLYPAQLLRQLDLPVDRQHGFVFESEVLIEAARLGVPARAVGTEALYPPGNRASHYRAGVDTLRIVRMVAVRLLCQGMHPVGLYRSLARRQR